jgi:hypothetical protein
MLQWQPPTCARNPEVQFVFPICIESLKTALANATCTYEDLVDVRESSGQHVRDILDFDLNDPRKVPASPSQSDHSLSDECRPRVSSTIFSLEFQKQIADLKEWRNKVLFGN